MTTPQKAIRICLAILFSLSSICIGINVYVNPFGYFGNKQLGEGEVFNAQIAKYIYLKQLPRKPDAFVLGSSNAMRMLPGVIDSLFGVRSYNFGVFQGTVEDMYCISNMLIKDVKARPRLIIMCIDDAQFATYAHPKDEVFYGAANRLSYKWEFSQYLPDFSWIVLRWSQFRSSISYEQMKYSLRNISIAIKKGEFEKTYPDISKVFYPDGVRIKYGNSAGRNITEEAESGKYPISEVILQEHRAALKKHVLGLASETPESFKGLQQERIDLFEATIALLEEHNCKVMVSIMPIQPVYQKIIAVHTDYEERIVTLMKRFREMQERHPSFILVKDNHKLENFNGLTEHFFDYMHPTSVNSSLMLRSMKEQLQPDAIQ